MTKTLFGAACVATTLLTPTVAAAQSGGSSCPSSARVASGSITVSQSDSPSATRTLRTNRQYVSSRSSSVTFGAVRISMPTRTTFELSCDERTPSVEVVEGRVDLRSRANRPGIVTTREGEARTTRTRGQTVRVSRAANLLNYGTTTIRRTAGSGSLRITPNVGSSRRTVSARRATLRSTRAGSNGRLEGTASYGS